jgi:hypothetical protein
MPFPVRQSFINPHPLKGRSLKIVARINKISNKRIGLATIPSGMEGQVMTRKVKSRLIIGWLPVW